MRTFIRILGVLLLLVTSALTQDTTSKAEIFGGYQYTSVDTGYSVQKRFNFNGWNLATTGFFSKHLGVTTEVSGSYGTIDTLDLSHYNFLVGPTVRFPRQRLTAFTHALFGLNHVKGSANGISGTDNDFAFVLGGGLDVAARKHLSIRIAQFDYLHTTLDGTTPVLERKDQKNFRYSGGLVFRF